VVGAAVAREISQIDLVGARQPQQHVRRHRSLIALKQRHVRRRDIEVGRHVGLRQATFAPQPAQSRPHEDRTGSLCWHGGSPAGFFCKYITTLHQNIVKPDKLSSQPLASVGIFRK